MNKSILLAGLAVVTLAFVSCQKELEKLEDSAAAGENTELAGEPVFFLTASVEESKTSLDGVTVNWSVGDQIVVNGVTSQPLTAESINGKSATFAFNDVLEKPYRAVYPASAYVADSDDPENDKATIIIPTQQNVTAGSFDPAAAIMIGKCKENENSLTFSHAVAYIKLTFDKPVKSVRVMANNGIRLRGWMDANFSSLTLSNHHDGWNFNTTTANCGEGIAAGESVILAIAPKDYTAGLNFFVVTTDDKYQILRTLAAPLSGKAGILSAKSATLSNLDTYQGPGIYCETDWRSFVCADESKFTSDVTQQEDASAWRGADGEINIYKDFSVEGNLHRHGANFANYPDATNHIYFLETLDGNNHTITQSASITPIIAWLGTASEAGTVKNLTLAGSCTEHGSWGNAAFAVRIFRGGVLDHCINRINTTYTETEAAHSARYFGGLVISNGGTLRDCENAGNMDITLLSDANRIFKLGGVACGCNYEGSCGDFIRCINSGNITIIKNASGTAAQGLNECGIGGICATVAKGVPGTEYTGVYSRFVQCRNEGTIKFWEERSGTSSSNQLALAVGGILGLSTKFNTSVPYVGQNDEGYYFIIDSCHNTGTLDVSSGNNIQALGNGMSGARQTYIGGLVGFAMGSNDSSKANLSTYYPIIRGDNNATIRLGSQVGCEAAGGLVGGGGFFKLDYIGNSSVVYAVSENPNRTPAKVGGVAAFVGWVVKRALIVPTSTVTVSMDASALGSLTVYASGVIGVTAVASKHANGSIGGQGTDSSASDYWNKYPLVIFENGQPTGNYFNSAIKHSDGTTEAAATLAAGYQVRSANFYGAAGTSSGGGTYLRGAGNLRFVAFSE